MSKTSLNIWFKLLPCVSRCKLLHTEWVNHKILLYNTGNYIEYPVINQTRKEYNDYTHVYNFDILLYGRN